MVNILEIFNELREVREIPDELFDQTVKEATEQFIDEHRTLQKRSAE
jgi:hypothetical protein